MENIKVAIYEDNTGLRETLSQMIRESEGFELAGEFGHCLDAINNTSAFKPDVILMDLDMPGKSGIEGVLEVKSRFPEVEVIINTVFEDEERIFGALKAGASGYLLKKNSMSNILESLKDVASGGAPMSPSIARKVLLTTADKKRKELNAYGLSDREFEILSSLAKGLSYKMIAESCHLSIDTVRSYIKKIYVKLHIHSSAEAIYKVFIDKN